MKVSYILPLATAASALVLPPEEVFSKIQIEDNHRGNGWYEEVVSQKDRIFSGRKQVFEEHFDEVADSLKNAWNKVADSTRNAVDEAFDAASETADNVSDKVNSEASNIRSWLESTSDEVYEAFDSGRRPHHPPHHHKPNETVYQLIAGSKYTTKLAELINKYDDLVEALNSTKANYTVFAPTDKAFEKIPDDAPEPSEEQLKELLSYHVVPDFYPAKRVLVTHTVPTLLKSDSLGSEPEPQRLAFKINFRGLTVNFYSRIIAINIFGTNGVIHGVDSILIPPPSVVKAIDLFPGEFSTLELGLGKTGLLEKINTTDHAGGTLFAPSNFAFKKLGPRVNAFLFSEHGLKYLKALLEYHVVPDNTLYSDAYYKASGNSEVENVPKGYFHVDLPTLLEDRTLAVDIARYGGFISIKVNAFSRVTVQDGIAKDGVIHVVGDVIVPPKKLGGASSEEMDYWDGEEMEVDDLIDRLEPYTYKIDL